ncbi:TMEM165/GDT1 family protein [Candidatus Bathyarchaeota archaeon]|nr:TMEM165/GDT1 family protein [Candidatus Bathyarchaeota archaeon]
MDLTPLVTSFILFTAMELGDKTQIAVVTMSMRDRPWSVFIGAIAAFALIDGASIALGGALTYIIPSLWINLGSGILFILLGLLCLIREENRDLQTDNKCTVAYAFSVILLMELGDKTQLVSMILSARYSNPFMVFIGVISSSIILTGGAIFIGRNMFRLIPKRYLRYITSLAFILFGLMFLINVLFGANIF